MDSKIHSSRGLNSPEEDDGSNGSTSQMYTSRLSRGASLTLRDTTVMETDFLRKDEMLREG